MIMALEGEGKEDPDLIRAVSGLGDGCGFSNETCGILTGASCFISWYAGKGSDDEKASKAWLPMLQDLGDWFKTEVEKKHGGTRCKDISGDIVGKAELKQICGPLLYKTYIRTNEILMSYGFMT